MAGPEYWSMFLFGGMVIMFGYLLEINFIKKGAEAFGLTNEVQPGAATGLMHQAATQSLPAAPTPTVDVQGLQDELQFLRNQVMQLGNEQVSKAPKGKKTVVNSNGHLSNGNGKH